MWVAGLPQGAEVQDVVVRLNGTDLPSTFLSQPDADGLQQVNCPLPGGMRPGPATVCLSVKGVESDSVAIELTS